MLCREQADGADASYGLFEIHATMSRYLIAFNTCRSLQALKAKLIGEQLEFDAN